MVVSSILLATLASSAARAPITESHLLTHLEELCHPRMEGRLTLQPGEQLAARYLAGEMKRIGLEEGWHDGYVHKFPVTVNHRPDGENRMVLRSDSGRTWNLQLGRDFVPSVGSKTEEATGRLVLVGWGVQNETRNDYAGVDLKGKFAVLFRKPAPGLPQATLRQRIEAAQKLGAAGVILVGPAGPGHTPLARMTRRHGVAPELGLKASSLHPSLLKDLAGQTFEELSKQERITARELPITATKKLATVPNQGMGVNIIGFLPGSDPVLKYEYIIVGAHYDHLGFGEVGSRTGNELLHPGADDNASGVAGVLELAEYFAHHRTNRRTIIFQLYSGEEVGLVGAEVWAREHQRKLVNASAMINMDMIGRVRDGRVMVMATSSSKEWAPIMEGIKLDGLTLQAVPGIAGNSDHAPFARRQLPVVFWHSGLTDEYHTEKDTVDTLNIPGMVKVLDGVKQMVKSIDQRSEKLAWNPEAQMAQRGGGGRGVRIGFQPDMASGGPGVRLSGVTTGSPAEKAGLKVGDRILQMGDRKLNNLEDMQAAFAALRPGTPVKLIVQRGDQTLEITLTPERAQQGG